MFSTSYLDESLNRSILLVYFSILLIIVFLQQEFVTIPQIMNISILDDETKSMMLTGFQKNRWLGFLVSPMLLLLRLVLISSCLFIRGILDDTHPVQRFGVCYNVALRANVVQVFYSILVCVMILTLDSKTASEVVNRFSLVFLIDKTNIEPWILFPIAALSIFEIAYWFLMSWIFAEVSDREYWNSFRFVMTSYGTGFLFYIIIVMGLMIFLL